MKKNSFPDTRIINASSARASLCLSSTGKIPPSKVIYSISKTALNALTVEYAKLEPIVAFNAPSPGHCLTVFNDFRGIKDPLAGAKVIVELELAERVKYEDGFRRLEREGKEANIVPW